MPPAGSRALLICSLFPTSARSDLAGSDLLGTASIWRIQSRQCAHRKTRTARNCGGALVRVGGDQDSGREPGQNARSWEAAERIKSAREPAEAHACAATSSRF